MSPYFSYTEIAIAGLVLVRLYNGHGQHKMASQPVLSTFQVKDKDAKGEKVTYPVRLTPNDEKKNKCDKI